MKKSIALTLLALTSMAGYAQNEYDALRYSQTDIIGTARYMGMAGAFGALGGDASAVGINPAGLGVYRSNEVSIGTGLNINTTKGKMDGITSKETKTHVPLNNLSFICSIPTGKDKGVVNYNFGFTFNKLKDFHRKFSVNGAANTTSMTDYMAAMTNGHGLQAADINPDNVNCADLSVLGYEGYLIDPDANDQWNRAIDDGETVTPAYDIREDGYINEWNIAFGMNVSNKVYWGFSMGLRDIDYSYTSYYSEAFENKGDLLKRDQFEAKGVGFNFGLGIIVRPIDQIRIGAAVHTPTFFLSSNEDYGIEENWNSSIYTRMDRDYNYFLPSRNNSYELNTPWRYNFSLAFILGHRGLLSLDYELTDFNSMSFDSDYDSHASYSKENDRIEKTLKASHSGRIGLEMNVYKGLYARLGYAFVTSPFEEPKKATKLQSYNTVYTNPEYIVDRWTNYYTAGIGYRYNGWFVDMAYMLRQNKSDFYAYNAEVNNIQLQGNPPSARLNSLTNIIALTAGLKF
jgi:hypothetical protein